MPAGAMSQTAASEPSPTQLTGEDIGKELNSNFNINNWGIKVYTVNFLINHGINTCICVKSQKKHPLQVLKSCFYFSDKCDLYEVITK